MGRRPDEGKPLSIGVFGGAFNPPHIGHLVCAREGADALGLEKVLFVPTGEAPHKAIDPEPGPELRLEMTRAAVAGEERFEVTDIELRRAGPSYTCDTLAALARESGEEELVLLIGADQAASLHEWRSPERVVELARIGVATRPGTDDDAVSAGLARVGAEDRAYRFAIPEIGVSSTLLREKVRAGASIRFLTPDPVVELIDREGLYR